MDSSSSSDEDDDEHAKAISASTKEAGGSSSSILLKGRMKKLHGNKKLGQSKSITSVLKIRKQAVRFFVLDAERLVLTYTGTGKKKEKEIPRSIDIRDVTALRLCPKPGWFEVVVSKRQYSFYTDAFDPDLQESKKKDGEPQKDAGPHTRATWIKAIKDCMHLADKKFEKSVASDGDEGKYDEIGSDSNPDNKTAVVDASADKAKGSDVGNRLFEIEKAVHQAEEDDNIVQLEALLSEVEKLSSNQDEEILDAEGRHDLATTRYLRRQINRVLVTKRAEKQRKAEEDAAETESKFTAEEEAKSAAEGEGKSEAEVEGKSADAKHHKGFLGGMHIPGVHIPIHIPLHVSHGGMHIPHVGIHVPHLHGKKKKAEGEGKAKDAQDGEAASNSTLKEQEAQPPTIDETTATDAEDRGGACACCAAAITFMRNLCPCGKKSSAEVQQEQEHQQAHTDLSVGALRSKAKAKAAKIMLGI